MSRNASDPADPPAGGEDALCLGCGELLTPVQWQFHPCPADAVDGAHRAAPEIMTPDELVAVMRDLGLTDVGLDGLGRPAGTLPGGRRVTIGHSPGPAGHGIFADLPPARALAEIARYLPGGASTQAAPAASARPAAAREDDPMPALTARDQQILAFERRHWTPGGKEHAIAEQFGLTETRYYQLLNDLIDRAEALTADPALVNRLRAQRARRQRVRRPRP